MASRWKIVVLAGFAITLPLLVLWSVPQLPTLRSAAVPFSGGTHYPASALAFESRHLGPAIRGLPLITNVQILNLDDDPGQEVLVCDAARNRLVQLQRDSTGDWRETTLVADVAAPAHATAVDIDGDGDLDLVVAVLGNLLPDDNVIGRVELYERDGDLYRRHVILDDVRRVADVQPGDFDQDGDIDMAVAVFGYARGEVLWLENRGNFQFRPHQLLNAPGAIHVPVADYDGDGDLDIAAIVTQDEEELWAFENLGGGQFQPRRLWFSLNYDLGSAGLVRADLDGDGDQDLILPVGDNLEDLDAYPQPYHGCYWFENRGNWQFEIHRISDLGGCYAADVGDLDGDGDLDVVLVSMTNNWYDPRNASVVWLENDGQQNFTTWQMAQAPIHLVTVAVGDLDGDGQPDVVAGSLNLRKPHQRVGGVTGWFNRGRKSP